MKKVEYQFQFMKHVAANAMWGGLLSVVIGVLILMYPDLLSILVAVLLIIIGLSSLLFASKVLKHSKVEFHVK